MYPLDVSAIRRLASRLNQDEYLDVPFASAQLALHAESALIEFDTERRGEQMTMLRVWGPDLGFEWNSPHPAPAMLKIEVSITASL
jgi:hypothetical protein